MDVHPPLEPDQETAIATPARECSLHHPAVAAQALAAADSLPGDAVLDPTPSQIGPTARDVVRFVRVHLLGPLAWSPRTHAPHRRNRVEERLEDPAIVDIRGAGENGQWYAVSVHGQVALGARLAPVSRIGSRVLTTVLCGDAGTIQRYAAPVDLTGIVQAVREILMEALPHAFALPVAQSTPAIHSAPAPEFVRKHLPRDARAKDKENPAQNITGGNRGLPPLGLGGSGGRSASAISHSASGTSGPAMAAGTRQLRLRYGR